MTTPEQWLFALKLFSALGCGLVAGVFFAFSTFVMGALGRLPSTQGIAAMQSINITAINPLFMSVFMGTAASCLALAIMAISRWSQPGAALLLGGCLLYLVGTFGTTIGGNVPLNDALANVNPESPEGAQVWANYLTNWTRWNHVRTVAALGAMVSFILAMRYMAP